MTQDHTEREPTDFDFGWAWDTEDFDAPQPRILDDPALPVTLEDHLVPIDRNGVYVPNHLDARGMLHFFAPVDSSDQPNFDDPLVHLRYFRVTQVDDRRLVHDSHPVMPLEPGGGSPFPLPALQIMLEEGDLDSAQELAYQTAQSYGLNFPYPENLPTLNTGVDYRFETGIEEDGSPAIEAVKAWREGSQDREQRLTIASYGMGETLAVDLRELNDLRETQGLEAAMNLAETMAVAGSYLHDGRDDARMFTEGPPDPFTTHLEHERAGEAAFIRDHGDEDTQPLPAVSLDPYAAWADEARREREANAPLEGAAWFEVTFAKSETELLQPIDETVNYAVVVQETDPWTTELMVEKYWLEPHGYLGSVALTIDAFDSDDKTKRALAETARTTLLGVHEERGLEAMMHQAELSAMEQGHLNGDRADTRLFRDGPPDRFETLAHRLANEPNPYSGIGDDRVEDVLPEPGSWEELVAAQTDDKPEPERHYWQMHYRPVETPEGERLGTALFVTEFPQVPPDFDDYIEEYGMDDSVYPTEARTVEMAHFANDDDARKFETEFRSYLVPGLLDGPELAPEVAKLEGLSGEWEDMDYRGIVDYMSGNRTVVREESAWHLHNPHAEREAQELQVSALPEAHGYEPPGDDVSPPLEL